MCDGRRMSRVKGPLNDRLERLHASRRSLTTRRSTAVSESADRDGATNPRERGPAGQPRSYAGFAFRTNSNPRTTRLAERRPAISSSIAGRPWSRSKRPKARNWSSNAFWRSYPSRSAAM